MNSRDRILQNTSVTFCVDTNILVEFRGLESLPWRELVPNAAHVHIVVPTKVAEEMDGHKKKTGRLRRRGMEFSATARAIEESPNDMVELRAADPRVTLVFGPMFRRSALDGNVYELEDDDGRVVAEVAKFMQTEPNSVLLSDDAKPLRLAKQTGLLHARPPVTWRREEGTDERDNEIERLKRELGAQPALVVEFPDLKDDDGSKMIVVDAPPATICTACMEGLVHAALSVDREVSRDSLIERYGIRQSDPFGITDIYGQGLRPGAIDEYTADYKAFVERLQVWAQGLPGFLTHRGIARPLTINISNTGDRAAERVHVEAELRGDFSFLPLTFFDDILEEHLEPPDIPKPMSELIIPDLQSRLHPERLRDDVFHELDQPDADGRTTFMSWRCNELRHGASFDLPVLVVAGRVGAKGALVARANGAVIAKGVESTAPLVEADATADAQFCTYLARRLELLPEKYRDACADALRLVEANCRCGREI